VRNVTVDGIIAVWILDAMVIGAKVRALIVYYGIYLLKLRQELEISTYIRMSLYTYIRASPAVLSM
jgi:hypothetical protein